MLGIGKPSTHGGCKMRAQRCATLTWINDTRGPNAVGVKTAGASETNRSAGEVLTVG
jgi:hypothetical protein